MGGWLRSTGQHRETQQQQEQKQNVMNNGIKKWMFTFIYFRWCFYVDLFFFTRMLGDLTNIF